MSRPDTDLLPGDFDEELAKLDPTDVQVVEASHDPHLVVHFTLDGDDAAALQEIARSRGRGRARS